MPAEHRVVRERFVVALDRLHHGVLELGGMVDTALAQAMQALAAHDLDLAQQVIKRDQRVNQKRFELETTVLDLLAMHQPMARDLRFITATLVIAIELERMGDYARGIAEITTRMGVAPPPKAAAGLAAMAELAGAMLRDVLHAFDRRDAELARAIPARDDDVDALNDSIFRDLVDEMISDPSTVNRATWLLWITHNVERLADRVTNVAERVLFMVTGELVELDVSSY